MRSPCTSYRLRGALLIRVVLGPLVVVLVFVWLVLVLARNQDKSVVIPVVMSSFGWLSFCRVFVFYYSRSCSAFAPSAVSSRRTQSSQKGLESYV